MRNLASDRRSAHVEKLGRYGVLPVLLAAAVLTAPAAAPSRVVAIEHVARYAVWEHAFRWPRQGYANPWEQVHLDATFVAPSGRRISVGGFHVQRDEWRVRFAPWRRGTWTWRVRVRGGAKSATFSGRFKVVAGKSPGFVRRSRYNRFRWAFSNGRPFYPLGLGDCVTHEDPGLDGPISSTGSAGRRSVDWDTYLRTYAAAGFNLFRWSLGNCAFRLEHRIDVPGNVYNGENGIRGDAFAQQLRRHGFRVYMTIFNRPTFGTNASPGAIAAVRRYVKYVVDRYGAYVDYWELMNETSVSPEWVEAIGSYLKRVDPYHHPLSTSWPIPKARVIDVTSPHWYQSENELDSDALASAKVMSAKQAGKPVVFGEQGNAYRNWDSRSAVRARLRAWGAFFAEGALIFWNTSGTKSYRAPAGNLYIGPEERQYFRVLQAFTSGFDRKATIAGVSVAPREQVRAYALRGPRGYVVYVVNYVDHVNPTTGVRVTINPRRGGAAVWIDPSTGTVLERQRVGAGRQVVAAPAFVTDVALKIS